MEEITPQKIQNPCLAGWRAKSKIQKIIRKKFMRQKISMLTAYDYSLAKILDDSGIDIVLVGDSLGNVILGHKDTLSVTMEDMIHHAKAVAKGVKRALLILDMPYKSTNTPEKALANAKCLMEVGADGVKVEGVEDIKGIERIVKAGIPVMGHLGCLPQSAKEYKIQHSPKIRQQAEILERAGVFSIVLELVVPEIAEEVTKAVRVPTIGIGSGSHCDGQVLVSYDMLGLYPHAPKHAKKYMDLRVEIGKAVRRFIKDII